MNLERQKNLGNSVGLNGQPGGQNRARYQELQYPSRRLHPLVSGAFLNYPIEQRVETWGWSRIT